MRLGPEGAKLWQCAKCDTAYATRGGIALHHSKRKCDGGTWRCDWCECEAGASGGKSPGPKGASTLCSVCASRYRSPVEF